MKPFINFGLLEEKDFILKTPLISRITAEHRGFLFLNFLKDIDIKIKTYIKLFLHNALLA